jgi:two-component system KDP operon response regulator KdpE
LKTVLVVDDDPTIRKLARLTLMMEGFAVSEAGDAAEALEIVSGTAQHFDLILLDLSLPGIGGADVIPQLRAHSPGSRILLVSGIAEEDAGDYGADGFLSKPFNRATLTAAVHTTLSSAL